MTVKNLEKTVEVINLETLDSFICRDKEYSISHKAFFTGFQHRTKVEFLRFFIV